MALLASANDGSPVSSSLERLGFQIGIWQGYHPCRCTDKLFTLASILWGFGTFGRSSLFISTHLWVVINATLWMLSNFVVLNVIEQVVTEVPVILGRCKTM